MDSKNTPQSKFYPSGDKTTLRFSVGALIFKGMASHPENKTVNLTCNKMSLSNIVVWNVNKKLSGSTGSGILYDLENEGLQ